MRLRGQLGGRQPLQWGGRGAGPGRLCAPPLSGPALAARPCACRACPLGLPGHCLKGEQGGRAGPREMPSQAPQKRSLRAGSPTKVPTGPGSLPRLRGDVPSPLPLSGPWAGGLRTVCPVTVKERPTDKATRRGPGGSQDVSGAECECAQGLRGSGCHQATPRAPCHLWAPLRGLSQAASPTSRPASGEGPGRPRLGRALRPLRHRHCPQVPWAPLRPSPTRRSGPPCLQPFSFSPLTQAEGSRPRPLGPALCLG